MRAENGPDVTFHIIGLWEGQGCEGVEKEALPGGN